ncbi:MAG: MoxR family ATPase [Gammaproteobacteria bacterium]|nr:MoxR family ATPase [Gammaproteobacteria bacterium]
MTCLDNLLEVKEKISKKIIGQEIFVNKLIIALLADGHILVEGAPGLAKTKAIREMGLLIEGDFHRIQFTPDLLPADLTGTEIYRPQDGSFHFQQGPLFHNLILADEINRAPAKVQAALLEAMAEHQITVGRETYALPNFFLVMATQNPIEQEGTYPLPEAQLDRFLMHLEVDYPDKESEKTILELNRNEFSELNTRYLNQAQNINNSAELDMAILNQSTLFEARQEILSLHMSEDVQAYLLALIHASRNPENIDPNLKRWIKYGASPRATIALDRCARAHAWLNGQDYVSPTNIQAVAPDVFRHRLLLSFDAEASGIDANQCINLILSQVAIP